MKNSEYKFRGYSKKYKNWVFGNLVVLGLNYFIIPDTGFDFREDDNVLGILAIYDWYEVIPESIGQYTGVEDKDKKEIYEGDILIDNSNEKYICEWGEIEAGFYLYQISSARTFYFPDFEKNGLKIIGNIYENSELVKED